MRELILNEVEYAYNSDTSLSDDYASFGYGADGVNFGAYGDDSLGLYTKAVSFQTPIQPDDVIQVEIKWSGNDEWYPLPMSEYAVTTGGSYYYGVTLGSGSNTDKEVFVKFGRGGARMSTTYGGIGTQYNSAHKWRVRKSKSANSGLLTSPELVENYSASNIDITDNLEHEYATLNLTAGTWLITANVHIHNSANTAHYLKIVNSTDSKTLAASMDDTANADTYFSYTYLNASVLITIESPKELKAYARVLGTTATAEINNADDLSYLKAVRIR